MKASGWAVVDANGINVRSVADTRRAAIVNWLWAVRDWQARPMTSDREIEEAWMHLCEEAVVTQVEVTAVSQ